MAKTSHYSSSKMPGKLFQLYLPAKTHRTYSCLHCRAQLANHDELISKVILMEIILKESRHFYSFSHFKVVKVERIYLILCNCYLYLSILTFCLFSLFIYNSVNVNASVAEERVLLTGLHEVADIYCECCKTLLGWKYVTTLVFTSSQHRIFVLFLLLNVGTCI